MTDETPIPVPTALQSTGTVSHGPVSHEYAYNYIFQELVEDENDLLGAVAYAIYKREKIAWLEDHLKTHGREPRPDEVIVFNKTSRSLINGFRSQAQEVLNDFIGTAVAQLHDDLSSDFEVQFQQRLNELDDRLANGADKVLDKHQGILKKALKDHEHSWPRIITEHVAAGILTILLAGASLLLLRAYFDKDEILVQVRKKAAGSEVAAEARVVQPLPPIPAPTAK